jgi:CheY-like chemotaxis protein
MADAELDSILGRIDSPDATMPAGAFLNLSIPPRSKAGASPGSLYRTRRRSVLIIDDDDRSRSAAAAALAGAQVPVREAADGTQGLSLLATLSPDLVVIEPEMRGKISGSEVLESIKARAEFAGVPTILYTRARGGVAGNHQAQTLIDKAEGPHLLLERIIGVFRRTPPSA